MKRTILETTWSDPSLDTVPHKHVLFEEDNWIKYHRLQKDGSGWSHKDFYESIEKGLKFFLKTVKEDQKSYDGKKIKIILPAPVFNRENAQTEFIISQIEKIYQVLPSAHLTSMSDLTAVNAELTVVHTLLEALMKVPKQ